MERKKDKKTKIGGQGSKELNRNSCAKKGETEHSKGSTWKRQRGRKEEVRLTRKRAAIGRRRWGVGGERKQSPARKAVRPARSPGVLPLVHEAAGRWVYGNSIHIGHTLGLAYPLQTVSEAGLSPPSPHPTRFFSLEAVEAPLY